MGRVKKHEMVAGSLILPLTYMYADLSLSLSRTLSHSVSNVSPPPLVFSLSLSFSLSLPRSPSQSPSLSLSLPPPLPGDLSPSLSRSCSCSVCLAGGVCTSIDLKSQLQVCYVSLINCMQTVIGAMQREPFRCQRSMNYMSRISLKERGGAPVIAPCLIPRTRPNNLCNACDVEI